MRAWVLPTVAIATPPAAAAAQGAPPAMTPRSLEPGPGGMATIRAVGSKEKAACRRELD